MICQPSLLVLLATSSSVAAHGFVQNFTVGGITYSGYNPTVPDHPPVAGWTTNNSDRAPIWSDRVGTPAVICHEDARPGQRTIKVKAGETITIQWTEWLRSHIGPVIDYLARCDGSCTKVDKTALKFFKIAEKGLISNTRNDYGYWGSTELTEKGSKWNVTIPSNLAPGNYVLRHEIIALHTAVQPGQAQLHPQCINIQVTGSGSLRPNGTAGTSLYRPTDAGMTIALVAHISTYTIPGPPLIATGLNERSHSRDFEME